jgi:transcriptional regulator with XRE-family HTH domain
MSATTTMTSTANSPAGQSGMLLRSWRERRRISQLDLALQAGVSARHVSFIETGRSQPSRAMLDRLGEHLEIPLRDRNQILMSAGYAPAYRQSAIEADAMSPVREALDQLLAGHEPFPAVAVDRNWNVLTANESTGLLLEGVAEELLTPPMNALRVSLHPRGVAPRIVNLAEYREHLLARLRRQVMVTGDEETGALLAELMGYPAPAEPPPPHAATAEVFIPMRLRHGDQVLSFFSTITTFGTALDVTLAELSVESFFPADKATGDFLRGTVR